MNSLGTVEAFHLAFLRALSGTLPPAAYCLKGGSNVRFFFGSNRYSEDMDLDVKGPAVFELRDKVMKILASPGLAAVLRPLGVQAIRPPELATAKQTETVQRFKVHLVTSAGEDLPTKVEFSRRGLDTPARAEPVRPEVLRPYRMPPLIVHHYEAEAAVRQKLNALADRRQPEARDVFDLHVLATFIEPTSATPAPSPEILARAKQRVFEIDFQDFRDKVVAFLDADHRDANDRPDIWDEIRLSVVALIDARLGHG